MKRSLFILAMLLTLGLSASAVELHVEGNHETISQKTEEDILYLGKSLFFTGEAKDLFFGGSNLNFTGKTLLAITALGDTIDVDGTVLNGVKAAGNNIFINGNIKGTNLLGGGSVMINPTSTLEGDSLIGAGRVRFDGKQVGDLYIGAGEVIIGGEIQGDVVVRAGRLQITDQGRIHGRLDYQAAEELSPEEQSRISGAITYKTNNDESEESWDFESSWWLEPLIKLALIVSGLVMLLLPATQFMERRYTTKQLGSLTLWGLLPILVYPTAILISFLLVLTFPIGLLMMLAFLPVVFITINFGLATLGGVMAASFNLKSQSRFLHYLIAAVPFVVISYIPYLHMVVFVLVSSVGCGRILFPLFSKELEAPKVSDPA